MSLQLLTGGIADAMLASRADARRAALRLAQFKHADIDFSGIGHVGHGFADELFRVFGSAHPSLEMHPVGMAPQVAAMVGSVRTAGV